MAALEMLAAAGSGMELRPCATSAEVFSRLDDGSVDAAVLPIENSLHGSVAEHYDLLLAHPVRIAGERLLRIQHNLIARQGVRIEEVRRVLSHPVALSQCRGWLARHPQFEAVSFYDTAGSVKHVVEHDLHDAAGVAPRLAAQEYGAEVLIANIEDHAENYTRFLLLLPQPAAPAAWHPTEPPNKASLAFSLRHQPGTLVRALQEFARAGLNLTRIESRPVPGTPWEYVFFVDLRFDSEPQFDGALAGLSDHCLMLRELGRYAAA